jgi:hypothetical protein
MGKVLAEFYDKAQQMGGSKAKMRIVMLTRTTVNDALAAPDNPDKIRQFENALKELKKEFGK